MLDSDPAYRRRKEGSDEAKRQRTREARRGHREARQPSAQASLNGLRLDRRRGLHRIRTSPAGSAIAVPAIATASSSGSVRPSAHQRAEERQQARVSITDHER
jgi:hypothetical protein